MGMPATEFKHYRETRSLDDIREMINQHSFDYHTIVIRAKIDEYQGRSGDQGADEIRYRY